MQEACPSTSPVVQPPGAEACPSTTPVVQPPSSESTCSSTIVLQPRVHEVCPARDISPVACSSSQYSKCSLLLPRGPEVVACQSAGYCKSSVLELQPRGLEGVEAKLDGCIESADRLKQVL